MNPEDRKLLERVAALSEENNAILRGLRRTQRVAAVFKAIYWIIIIGAAVGAYYALEPYLQKLQTVYGTFETNIGQIGKAGSAIGNLGNFGKQGVGGSPGS